MEDEYITFIDNGEFEIAHMSSDVRECVECAVSSMLVNDAKEEYINRKINQICIVGYFYTRSICVVNINSYHDDFLQTRNGRMSLHTIVQTKLKSGIRDYKIDKLLSNSI